MCDDKTTDRYGWTRPEPQTVAPGIHRIALPLPSDGLTAVNVYALEHDDGVALVDGGWAVPEAEAQLSASLAGLGYGMGDVTDVLVTHAHRDHYTLAIALRRDYGRAHISIGADERRNLDMINDRHRTENPLVTRLAEAGAGNLAGSWAAEYDTLEPDLSTWAYPDTWLEDGVTIALGSRELEAIHTPGHTPGHFVFADFANDLLFSGDHLLPTITPSVGFSWGWTTAPLLDYMTSLRSCVQMEDSTLMPAHGWPGMSSRVRAAELLDHHEARLRLSLEAIDSHGSTAFEVAKALPWTRHHRMFDDLDIFNQGMACMETSMHLDVLVITGDLLADESTPTKTYVQP
jgi:glyoxylase-like metal-dependent hydrolase (beta-lactamase superfamily II)